MNKWTVNSKQRDKKFKILWLENSRILFYDDYYDDYYDNYYDDYFMMIILWWLFYDHYFMMIILWWWFCFKNDNENDNENVNENDNENDNEDVIDIK